MRAEVCTGGGLGALLNKQKLRVVQVYEDFGLPKQTLLLGPQKARNIEGLRYGGLLETKTMQPDPLALKTPAWVSYFTHTSQNTLSSPGPRSHAAGWTSQIDHHQTRHTPRSSLRTQRAVSRARTRLVTQALGDRLDRKGWGGSTSSSGGGGGGGGINQGGRCCLGLAPSLSPLGKMLRGAGSLKKRSFIKGGGLHSGGGLASQAGLCFIKEEQFSGGVPWVGASHPHENLKGGGA